MQLGGMSVDQRLERREVHADETSLGPTGREVAGSAPKEILDGSRIVLAR